MSDGHDVTVARSISEAEGLARTSTFVCALVDVTSIRVYPPEAVRVLRRGDYGVGVLFVVADPIGSIADDLRRIDGTDIMRLPADPQELALRVQRMREALILTREADSLRGERDIIYHTEDIIAQSAQMLQVLDLVNRVAFQPSNVLLTGETGTGKGLLAGAIHYSGPRRHRAFIKVNCAALPEPLLESELFGHEKGAFTGANRQRIGRFEQADGGSILLDEVGEIGLSVQTKLLRAVQEKQFERLGGERTVSVDTRIIAATNRDLARDIRERTFREDLFYRLAVITINVPPLRERREDIIPLADYLLGRAKRSANLPEKHLSEAARTALLDHEWPGNVREMQNAVERGVIMSDHDELFPADLGVPVKSASVGGLVTGNGLKEPTGAMERAELQLMLDALAEAEWVQKDAARALGISARALNYRIKKAGVTHPSWRQNR